jgi:hypothetical protein
MKIEYFRHDDNNNILATMVIVEEGPDKGKYGLCFTKPRENGDKKMGRETAKERLISAPGNILSGTQLGKLLYKMLVKQKEIFLPLAEYTGGNFFVTVKEVKGIIFNHSRKSVDLVSNGDNGEEIRSWIGTVLSMSVLDFKVGIKQY